MILKTLLGPWIITVMIIPLQEKLGEKPTTVFSFWVIPTFGCILVLADFILNNNILEFLFYFCLQVIHIQFLIRVAQNEIKPKAPYTVVFISNMVLLFTIYYFDIFFSFSLNLSIWFLLFEMVISVLIVLITLDFLKSRIRFISPAAKALNQKDTLFWKSKIDPIISAKENFCDPEFNLDSLAEALDVSRFVLSKKINTIYNCGFNDILNSHRIEKSKEMIISNGDHSILEIAFLAGFNSKTTFYRIFKQKTGISPVKYKKDFLEGHSTKLSEKNSSKS